MDIIDEGRAFQRYGIMLENERRRYLRDPPLEGSCVIKRCILEVKRLARNELKSTSNIYEGVEEYTGLWVIERSRISDRF